jgi:muramoyltetrapeptide carboxypeptidase
VQGVLAGGNLALLSALAGTRFAPRLTNAILVLEDIDEAVYRVDRMLRQLLLAGSLDDVRAIAFGACTNCPEASDDGSRRLDDVLFEVAEALGVPALAGVPVGHIENQWTLPLGASALLDADRRTLSVLPNLTIA